MAILIAMIQVDIGMVFLLSFSLVTIIVITAKAFKIEYPMPMKWFQIFLSIVVIISLILLLINGEFTFT